MLVGWGKLTNTEISVPCVDNNKHCSWWSRRGECIKSADYMLVNCRKSCKVCTGKEIRYNKLELSSAKLISA